MASKTQKQTKTKTKTKTTKGSKQTRKIELPNGFQVIGRAPSWQPEEVGESITGPRGPTHTRIMDEGKKNEREQRNFVVEDAELGPVTVWESGWLKQLFDETEEGDEVFIEYKGKGTASKKGMQPPRMYVCGKK